MLISGKIYWGKIIGAPRPNKFNPTVPQWSFDLSVDEDTAEKLLGAGMKKTYLRDKQDERGTFLTFTRDSIKKDGSAGKPFSVVDSAKNPWPDGKQLGNGTEVNVVVSLNERTFRGEKFLKPSAVAVQVWDLVKYDSGSFPTKDVSLSEVSTEGVEATAEW